MNQKTTQMLATLESAPLFRSVGIPDSEESIIVDSWLAAMSYCVGREWTNTTIEALNVLGEEVARAAIHRYQVWNNLIHELRPPLWDFAQTKAEPLIRERDLPKDEFVGCVYADVLGIAMECEYSDIVPPGFFHNVILTCYLKGHFPCGWKGEFPEGRLIAY